jgi:hypothetical protein
MSRIITSWVALQLLAVGIPCAECRAEQPPGEPQAQRDAAIDKEVDAMWGQLKEFDRDSQASADDDGALAYWIGVTQKCFKLTMQSLDGSKDERRFIEIFVSKFGSGGAQSDIRWILSCQDWTLDVSAVWPVHGEKTESDRKARNRQLLVAEFHTRRLLSDPKMLGRYYEAVVWYDWMFSAQWFPTYLHRTKTGLEREAEYWWHARNFILLAHATGRDDLLRNAKPDDLKPRYEEWREWFDREGGFLRASMDSYTWKIDDHARSEGRKYESFEDNQELPALTRPNMPFPDWKGPPPLPPSTMRKL